MPLFIPPINIVPGGNTAGATASISSGTFTLAGGNNITLSQAGNAITISGGAGGGGFHLTISGNTAGVGAIVSSGTLTLAGGNNITLSQADNAITISAFNQTVQTQNVHNVTLSGNTAGVMDHISSGTLTLAGGNNITLSQDGNAVTISAGAGGSPVYLSVYEPYPFVNTGTGTMSANTNTSGAISLFRFNVYNECLAEFIALVYSMTGSTTSQPFTHTHTIQWGIYSNPTGANNTLLTLLGSSSFSLVMTQNNGSITMSHPTATNAGGVYGYGTTSSAASNLLSQYSGLKMVQMGLNSTIYEGDYWLGLHHRMSTGGNNNGGLRFSLYGQQHTLSVLAPIGSLSSQYSTGTKVPLFEGGNWLLAHGSYTLAGLTGLTNNITMSQITQNLTLMPYMKFVTRV
jgi:hypothetical protein